LAANDHNNRDSSQKNPHPKQQTPGNHGAAGVQGNLKDRAEEEGGENKKYGVVYAGWEGKKKLNTPNNEGGIRKGTGRE